MLREIQRQSFGYFLHEPNELNGLVPDKTAPSWPASIAAVGMALTAYPIGVERGWMTRAHALERSLRTLRFFAASEQSESPGATGYRGFYYHFLDCGTGRRAVQSELSSIDTALLIAGMLTVAAFFDADTDDERELRNLADALYARVDWRWMCHGDPLLRHGWMPEGGGFLPYRWQGYDESMLMYLLALGAPHDPLPPATWNEWLRPCAWTSVEGIEYLHAGPLFIHQFAHVWLDLRGLQDAFMRAHASDYFQNSRKAVRVQQRYAERNPGGFAMYSACSWGLTASDGPGEKAPGERVGGRLYFDYVARGVPDGPDDGTLSPWAVVASLPFAPEIVLPTIEQFQSLQLHVGNRYGFRASFNPTFPGDREHPIGWVSKHHFGINEGPTVMMVANQLDGTIWRLMRRCAPFVDGLRRAGFEGGWLDAAPA